MKLTRAVGVILEPIVSMMPSDYVRSFPCLFSLGNLALLCDDRVHEDLLLDAIVRERVQLVFSEVFVLQNFSFGLLTKIRS